MNAPNEDRSVLRRALGIEHLLEQRSVLELSQSGVHCEVYGMEQAAPKGILIFLPGIGTYSELYAELLSKLSSSGYVVVSVDYPGHGFSRGERGEYTVESVKAAVTELLDVLLARMSLPVGIFGYSIGSLLGLAVAESDDRIDALLCGTLILPDVPPDPSYTLGWWMTHQQAFFFPSLKVPLRMFVDLPRLLASHPAAHNISRDKRIIFDYPLKTLSSLYSYQSKVQSEQLGFKAGIIHGVQDEVLPVSYSRRLALSLKHPFDSIEVKGTGHMAPWLSLDAYGDKVIEWFGGAFS